MKYSKSFLILFCILFFAGCSTTPINPTFDVSEFKSNDGIAFGKIESVTFNGEKVEASKCYLTYGESWSNSAEGGFFQKSIALKAGTYFAFPIQAGQHFTHHFTCYFDDTLTSEFRLPYIVQANAVNYLGRFKIDVTLGKSTSNKLKILFSPLPTQLDGGLRLYVEDRFKEDSLNYLKGHPELKNFRAFNTTVKF